MARRYAPENVIICFFKLIHANNKVALFRSPVIFYMQVQRFRQLYFQ